MRPNSYSRQWFETFLGRIDESVVEREVAFLQRQLDRAARVLDLCCGPGRHAQPLAVSGHHVIGIDLDATALRDGAARAPDASFVRADMRALPLADASVDAVICMWQSFGHFDDRTNQRVVAEMARVVSPGGRVILDLYHREFHASRLGARIMERDGVRVHERRTIDGERLRAHLRYETDASEEVFEWRLYTPETLAKLGSSTGLEMRHACAEFDERIPASADHSRMQAVFSR